MIWQARFAALAAGVALLAAGSSAEELCSLTPDSYSDAATTYPYLANAISALSEYSTATWYTDRVDSATMISTIEEMVSTCDEDARLSIVVYGLPNKDCSGGYSSSGWVSDTDDYKTFLNSLTEVVGDRKVLYVVEPDAVGLLAESGGCGSSNGYLENLQVALEILSENENADMYLDVGYWNLQYESNTASVVSVIQELVGSGRLKGIALNTSNYRSTAEISTLCSNFQTAYGSTDLHCIIDTSRNYVDPTSTDWCNVLTAGVGLPPSNETGYSNLDYMMWIKVIGESDGDCNGGPSAGSFFADGFAKLWNQGYFVAEASYTTVDSSSSSGGQATTTSSPTAAPTTSPSATTATPTSTADAQTDAPGTVTPAKGSASSSGSEAQGDADSSSSDVEGEADSSTSTDSPAVTTATPTATTAAPATTTATPTEAPTATTATPTATTATPTATAKAQCKPKMRKRKL